MASSTSSGFSKEFYDLVKSIGESRSKSEEDSIISREVRLLKQRLLEKGGALTADNKKKKELLIRLMYVELLGHDASFGYVHAVQLTASQDLAQKRVGYLCCSLFLSPDNEFRFMLINQLNRDMQSSNMLEVAAALVAVCKLLTLDALPALLPTITELLKHEQNVVRKKAVMALHRCYQLSPEAISHLTESFRRTLCDKDPSVMGASLVLLHELAKADPVGHKDLVPSYVSILKQITEHRLPREFDYHRIPAPWIQIKLLQILAVLGKNDQRQSEQMYTVIHECMRRADTGINVGYAIVYECVKTVTMIYPNTVLLDAAASAISRFITSENHNLKYLGVTGLASIVRDHPRYAAAHQMAVLDCLEDPDETLKRKTLDLLFKMTNPVNAEVVVSKLLTFLAESRDKYLRSDLVSRITQLAERYSPDNVWYIKTMTSVFELGGELVDAEVPHTLLRLLAEGSDDEDADLDMRTSACENFAHLLEESHAPDVLLKVMFWTLGEYGYLTGQERLPGIMVKICEIVDRQSTEAVTRGYGISALMKITAQLGVFIPRAVEINSKYAKSVSVDLQQRCAEFRELAKNPASLKAVLPVDASCEDFGEIDWAFLNGYVDEMLRAGAPEYVLPASLVESLEDDEETANHNDHSTLRYDAYEVPKMPDPAMYAGAADLTYDEQMRLTQPASSLNEPREDATGFQMKGVKSVWGRDGYTGNLGGAMNGQIDSQIFAQIAASQAQAPRRSSEFSAIDLSGMTISNGKPDLSPRTAAGKIMVADLTPNYDEVDGQDKQEERALTPSVTPPAAAPETSERERVAAALFSGLDSAYATGKQPAASSSRPKPKARANQAPSGQPSRPSPTPSTNVDLLGFGDSTPIPGAAKPAPAKLAGEIDLLGSAFDIPAPAQPHTSTILAPSVASGLDDLLSAFGAPATTTAPLALAPVTGLTTQGFGGQWGAHAAETRVAIPLHPPVSTIDAIASRVTRNLGATTVEVILETQEAIFAGSTPGLPAMQSLVLIHAKTRPLGDMVDLIIRSGRPMETQRVAQAASTCLVSD